MKKIRVLHIAEIDNDLTKGTSTIIPEYINAQQNEKSLEVSFLNCNNNVINKINNKKNMYLKKDNTNMEVIKTIKPNLVVFHEIYKPDYLKIYKYLLKENIKYIIIPHGGMTKNAQNSKFIKKYMANFLVFYNFFKNAEMIQYLSENEKENTKFSKLNCYVLGNGINNIPINNMYVNNKKRVNNKINFIYVGRYDFLIKGIDQLVEAFLAAKNQKLNVVLNLYGKGDNKTLETISDFIKNNNLEEYIKFNGPIFGEKKRSVIINNDIFIQVSRTEGQPLGVMEAMSLGMPVLLSYGTGYKNIVENHRIGKICNTKSDDILKCIKYFINNAARLNEFSNNSFNYANDNYSWDIIVLKTVKIYKKIIK